MAHSFDVFIIAAAAFSSDSFCDCVHSRIVGLALSRDLERLIAAHNHGAGFSRCSRNVTDP
jgi:hypothetical protein